MADQLTLSIQKPSNPALDYEALRRLGVARIEKVGSSIWTDYNIHDPGITILELLCYALTDLTYRAEYAIPDLLATEEGTVANIKKHFLTAKNIFPNNPVTVEDYRKILIDIEGVKNAWLIKNPKTVYADLIHQRLSTEQPTSRKWKRVVLKGFYKVLLEFDLNVPQEKKGEICDRAKAVLNKNRNLCEDFTTIDEIEKETFRLCGEIEVAADADPIEVLARSYFNIQLYLTPMVRFYRLADLLIEGIPSDRIFEGPLLTHGFIKDEELAASALRQSIQLSDVMHQVLTVEGVKDILEIQLNSISELKTSSNKNNKWIIDISPGRQPTLDIDESRMILYKNGIPFRPHANLIKARFDELMDAYIKQNEQIATEDLSFDTGNYRNIAEYHSIQEHFPKCYGISHWGLPEDASAQRKFQAKQLKGYLYLFDQMMADFLAQLANTNNIFSPDPAIDKTYFTQLAADFKDAENLFVHPLQDVKEAIQAAAENNNLFYQRRNLFLDHLLARYAESFSDYVNTLNSIFPGADPSELVQVKARFLTNYQEYSSQRFSGLDYKAPLQSENSCGLEKRLQRLLGLPSPQKQRLTNLYTAIFQDEADEAKFHFKIIDNRSGAAILFSSKAYASEEMAKRELERTLRLAVNPARLSIKEVAESTIFQIEVRDDAENLLAHSPEAYSTRAEGIAQLSLIQNLLENKTEEGLYLVENILLLPQSSPIASPPHPASGCFLPLCVDSNCEDCEDHDPYSFRISIILPAYANRFFNMDFRRYCERVIRMETPAHILPRICWINNEQLSEFENTYKDWLEVKAGRVNDDDHAILHRFLSILSRLNNVYPPARLQDCNSTEEIQLFLLNQNALGTLK